MNSKLKYIPDKDQKDPPSVHLLGNLKDLYNILKNTSFSNISIKKIYLLLSRWYIIRV